MGQQTKLIAGLILCVSAITAIGVQVATLGRDLNREEPHLGPDGQPRSGEQVQNLRAWNRTLVGKSASEVVALCGEPNFRGRLVSYSLGTGWEGRGLDCLSGGYAPCDLRVRVEEGSGVVAVELDGGQESLGWDSFDQDAWIEGGTPARRQTARDLVSSRALMGLTFDRVTDCLGAPDRVEYLVEYQMPGAVATVCFDGSGGVSQVVRERS